MHTLAPQLITMFILTFAVWVLTFATRVPFILKNKLDLQKTPSPETLNPLLPQYVTNPANNLRNLTEVPVIFYALAVLLMVMGLVDSTYSQLAWVFVVFRIFHSIVQSTFNIVKVRFAMYLISSLALWLMVLRLAVQYFAQS